MVLLISSRVKNFSFPSNFYFVAFSLPVRFCVSMRERIFLLFDSRVASNFMGYNLCHLVR